MFNHLVFLAILVTNDGLQNETEVELQADVSSPLLSLKISTVVIFPIFFSGHVSLRKREASVALRLDRTPAQCGKEDFDATQISHWLLLLILPPGYASLWQPWSFMAEHGAMTALSIITAQESSTKAET